MQVIMRKKVHDSHQDTFHVEKEPGGKHKSKSDTHSPPQICTYSVYNGTSLLGWDPRILAGFCGEQRQSPALLGLQQVEVNISKPFVSFEVSILEVGAKILNHRFNDLARCPRIPWKASIMAC